MNCSNQLELQEVISHSTDKLSDMLKEKVLCETETLIHQLERGYRPDTQFIQSEIQLIDMLSQNQIDEKFSLYALQYYLNNLNGGYCEYRDTGEFTEDTESQDITETATTKLAYPIFVGAVPYWWNAQEDITMESLRRLAEEEPKANYIITDQGPKISNVSKSIQFTDTRQRSIVIAVPNNYPDLKTLKTPAQQKVTAEAFAKWVQPMYPNQAEVGVLYKIYVFKQPLVNLQQTIDVEFEQTKTEEP